MKTIDDNQFEQNLRPGIRGSMPEAKTVFVYGIVAICTSFLVVGMVFGIIALIKEKPLMRKLTENYEYYKYEKWKLVVGKSLAWGSFGMFLYIWGYTALMIAIQEF